MATNPRAKAPVSAPPIQPDSDRRKWAKPSREFYHQLGINLMPLTDRMKKNLDDRELVDRWDLFHLARYGDLKGNILGMAGICNPDEIAIERGYTKKGNTLKARVSGERREICVYLKINGMEPDELALELLKPSQIIVPRLMRIEYTLPYGDTSEYGVIQDIGSVEGVRAAVSLRALARHERLSQIVLKRLDEFAFILGHAFETCRMFGIQDRRSRNMHLIEKDDGSLAIGMIDLDLVACYPNEKSYQIVFSQWLKNIMGSLDFAFEHGELVRSDPSSIRRAICNEDISGASLRMQKIRDAMLDGFMQGAETTHLSYTDPGTQARILRQFELHHGKPVGIYLMGEMLYRLLGDRRKGEYCCNKINGKVQDLIPSGPNSGRFLLESTESWNNGFMVQVDGKPSDFWMWTLDRATEWFPIQNVY
jgi:hypothetical protein